MVDAGGSGEGFRILSDQVTNHSFYHLVEFSCFMNPRFISAYSAEGYMGQLLNSAKACVPGSEMYMVGNKVLQNAMLALNILLTQMARDL